MQRRQLAYIVVSSMFLGASGCVPAKYVEVPALRGRVIDADGQPIRDATVQVIRDSDGRNVGTTVTRPDGTFSRPEQSTLTIQFAGPTRALRTYSVTATADERASSTTQVSDGLRRWFFWFYDPPTDRDLGELVVR